MKLVKKKQQEKAKTAPGQIDQRPPNDKGMSTASREFGIERNEVKRAVTPTDNIAADVRDDIR